MGVRTYQPSITGVVAVGPRAVEEILLAQREEGAGLPEVLTLEGPGRRERPARAALDSRRLKILYQ